MLSHDISYLLMGGKTCVLHTHISYSTTDPCISSLLFRAIAFCMY